MSMSKQVITGPTLRQFATVVEDDDLVVTSKLGPSTVSRVRFKRLAYPATSSEQAVFLKALVLTEYPVAMTILGKMFEQCIEDQAKAINQLLAP